MTMQKRRQIWLRRDLDAEAVSLPERECWVVCEPRDKGATLFVQATGFNKFAELEKYAKLTPWDLRAFYSDEHRFEAASWEAKAQYYEFMADATRMFAPVEG